MSYDLAVWEGERPTDDKTAGRILSGLYDRYIDSEVGEPPSERIATYVAALLERWCDLTEDVEDASPWSTGPLIREASGPLINFPMRWSMAEEASAYVAAVAGPRPSAHLHGSGLRPPPGRHESGNAGTPRTHKANTTSGALFSKAVIAYSHHRVRGRPAAPAAPQGQAPEPQSPKSGFRSGH